ncbi:MAG: GNAT family N-acetyltransferase [Proteobacteria bacterium]|nr:GNAT family N-acetyltransferase [Pseudomonadota bacterium]MBI3498221.1 GNAT family N-acetyltransferase [Pseudomonadota bacterium]
MADVDLRVASAEERGALENLIQLYTHDFSEQWSGTPKGELDEDGRFSPYVLDPYWQDKDHIPLLLRVEGRLAGFALLNRTSHLGDPVDRNMAEFFVARKHRRAGLGKAAVGALFSRYPGLWEIAVARRNVGALAFWRRTILQHPQIRDPEETDVRSTAWNGPVLRFRVASV